MMRSLTDGGKRGDRSPLKVPKNSPGPQAVVILHQDREKCRLGPNPRKRFAREAGDTRLRDIEYDLTRFPSRNSNLAIQLMES